MASFLIAAAIAAASIAPAAAPGPAPAPPTIHIPDADPAIWVVNDQDTVIYLFGTFHALDPSTRWFEGSVRDAFVSADELVLETIIPEPAPVVAAASAPNLQRYQSAAINTGGSFLASTRMALSASKGQGMRFELGADSSLMRAARASGKPILGLETLQGQLEMFDRVPAGQHQPSAAPQPAAAMTQLASTMGVMQQSWSRGDGEVFAGMLDEMRQSSPQAYRLMFVQRNAQWAQWISRRLQQPGTAFVAVGAGHLSGSDSVQNKLAMIGIRSIRVD
jgi:uncharacterized protein